MQEKAHLSERCRGFLQVITALYSLFITSYKTTGRLLTHKTPLDESSSPRKDNPKEDLPLSWGFGDIKSRQIWLTHSTSLIKPRGSFRGDKLSRNPVIMMSLSSTVRWWSNREERGGSRLTEWRGFPANAAKKKWRKKKVPFKLCPFFPAD